MQVAWLPMPAKFCGSVYLGMNKKSKEKQDQKEARAEIRKKAKSALQIIMDKKRIEKWKKNIAENIEIRSVAEKWSKKIIGS